MITELALPSSARLLPADTISLPVPASIAQAGPSAAERFLEFFAANIRNPNTRLAYARAVRDFFDGPRSAGSRYPAYARCMSPPTSKRCLEPRLR